MTTVQKANHARATCMTCKEAPPDNDALWQDGDGGLHRAWMCSKCFPSWYAEKGESVIHVHKVDGVAPSRYRPIRHSPKEGRKKTVNKATVLKINGDTVTLSDLAHAWLEKADRFTSAPWSSPEANLSPADFAKVCLINLNDPGSDPVKAKCKLPVRSTPAGPVNLNALRNAAARLPQTDAPEEAKREAARKLIKLMRQAGIEVGPATLALANESVEKAEEITLNCEIIKANKKRHTITSVVLQPGKKDAQKDVVSEDDILDAIHDYMIKSRAIDYRHQEVLPFAKAVPVEVYAAPLDFELDGHPVKKGAWVMTTKILDAELWGEIEKGKLRAYSVKGWGKRTKINPT